MGRLPKVEISWVEECYQSQMACDNTAGTFLPRTAADPKGKSYHPSYKDVVGGISSLQTSATWHVLLRFPVEDILV